VSSVALLGLGTGWNVTPLVSGRIQEVIALGQGLFVSYQYQMGTESIPERSESLHILTQLSTWEHFIEFCGRESLRTISQMNVFAEHTKVVCIFVETWVDT